MQAAESLEIDPTQKAAPGMAGSMANAFVDNRWLTVRYIVVSGAFGVPASIAQLTAMLFLYRHIVGSYGFVALNAMWVLNFEISLVRNFLLHCWVTWRKEPTWRRLRHAHVAATGAFVIDIAAFNAVHRITGIVPLAQLFGAGSGFAFNFLYNKMRTFSASSEHRVEEVPV